MPPTAIPQLYPCFEAPIELYNELIADFLEIENTNQPKAETSEEIANRLFAKIVTVEDARKADQHG